MRKYTAFGLFWVHNCVLLYLASIFFPTNFVLGTFRHTILMAVLLASLVWTLIVWFVRPIQKAIKVKLEGRLMLYPFYFVANFAALWVTSHLAPYTGFGVSKFTWLIGLAVVANIIQATIWRIGNFSK